jgi:stage IV sporulation protein FB
MPHEIRLARFGKTTIDIELSFFILLTLFVFSDLDNKTKSLRDALLWVPILLISLLVHELAHAGTIKLLGFGPSRIFLTGWGGVTVNERRARPWQDLLISLAGPVSSFLLAAAIYPFINGTLSNPFLAAFLPKLATINVVWAIFNLLPVMPLDGGHAVRHVLRMFMTELRAFHVSVISSLIIGAILGLIALRKGEWWVAIVLGLMLSRVWQQWQMIRNLNKPEPGPPPE